MPEADLGAIAAQIDAWAAEIADLIMSLATPDEWEYDGKDSGLYPPDLTPGAAYSFTDTCLESRMFTDTEWECTRLPNHTGRHAAGDGDIILAVWR